MSTSSTWRSRTSITRVPRARSPQTNGICERFHKTVLDEFYRVAFRKKLYRRIEELQRDLDAWLEEYNEERPHQGRWCYGKTPMQTFIDSVPVAKEKMLSDVTLMRTRSLSDEVLTYTPYSCSVIADSSARYFP